MERLGTFEVSSAIVVVDPCYKQGDNLEVRFKARKGKWIARVSYENEFGIQCIIAHHVEFVGGTSREISSAAVDSGQLGIWDADFWEANNDGSEYTDVGKWYRNICDLTLENKGGKYGEGVVSETGGDGCFPVYAIFDKDEVVSVTVHFLQQD